MVPGVCTVHRLVLTPTVTTFEHHAALCPPIKFLCTRGVYASGVDGKWAECDILITTPPARVPVHDRALQHVIGGNGLMVLVAISHRGVSYQVRLYPSCAVRHLSTQELGCRHNLLRRGSRDPSDNADEAAALDLPGSLLATHLYISPTLGTWQAVLCVSDEFANVVLGYLGADCGEREVAVAYMASFRLHVVRVEAPIDLELAASRGLHSGSHVFDEDRLLAARTAGGLTAPTSGGPPPPPFGFGSQVDDFSAGAFGRAGVALGSGSPAAGQHVAGAPDPVTPTAGTKYSFGAAVRARGSGGSTASDVSSVSAGSWQRNVSPVRQPAPSTSPGGARAHHHGSRRRRRRGSSPSS